MASTFVLIDGKASETIKIAFGVPECSIMGHALFNLCVNDLSDRLGPVKSYQHADDTTLYHYARPSDLMSCKKQLQLKKTKVMMFSTEQHARVHSLQDYQSRLNANGMNLERVKSARLLGSELHKHLK